MSNSTLALREAWLSQAVELLRPLFKQRKLELPPSIKVSCGFPSKGGLAKERPTTGETWPAASTFDSTVHIFITPLEDDPARVLGMVTRHAIQAALPDDAGFGPNFKAACKDLGMEGNNKHALPGMELQKNHLDAILDTLGDYPHSHLIPAEKAKADKPKKKSSFKLFCSAKRECDSKKCSLTDKAVGEDYTTTVAAKKLVLGFPMCPCSREMVMEEEDFKIWTEGRRQSE